MISGLVAMSMVAHLKMISAAQAAELHNDSKRVAQLVSLEIAPMPPHPKSYAEVRPSLIDTARFGARQMGIRDVDFALQMAKQNAPQFAKEIEADKAAYAQAVSPPSDELLLEKAWHGIHFLLTGKSEGGASPWKDAIMGGTPIGDDVGYGPAQLLAPSDVKRVAAALQTLSPAALRMRFDAKKMEAAKVYPFGWNAEAAEWVEHAYSELRDFYRRAAEKNDAVLIWVN
jgi:uncharacterized protein DUF1877